MRPRDIETARHIFFDLWWKYLFDIKLPQGLSLYRKFTMPRAFFKRLHLENTFCPPSRCHIIQYPSTQKALDMLDEELFAKFYPIDEGVEKTPLPHKGIKFALILESLSRPHWLSQCRLQSQCHCGFENSYGIMPAKTSSLSPYDLDTCGSLSLETTSEFSSEPFCLTISVLLTIGIDISLNR